MFPFASPDHRWSGGTTITGGRYGVASDLVKDAGGNPPPCPPTDRWGLWSWGRPLETFDETEQGARTGFGIGGGDGFGGVVADAAATADEQHPHRAQG